MKEYVQAIHSSEIEEVFKSLKLSEALASGSLHCYCCGMVITKSNFQSMTRHNGELLFACDKENCTLTLASLTQQD